MLDFGLLQTPKEHGDVLVLPEPRAWIDAAQQNATRLNACNTPILDTTLGTWRRKTREAVVGNDPGPVFVTGHQPEFIHPGVWAKHVVAARAAAAAEGIALNLVVDNDSPRSWSLTVPTTHEGDLNLTSISMGDWKRGLAYDQFPAMGVDDIRRVGEQVAAAMGRRFGRTPMNLYLESLAHSPLTKGGTGILPAKTHWLEANAAQKADVGQQAPMAPADDWVTQTVTARRRVEGSFGVDIVDRRVSEVWCSPLMVDMLIHADQFAAAYNQALVEYRTAHRVRGVQRPIPDLHVESDRTEVAVWAYRQGEPRRRLFVTHLNGAIRLDADGVHVGEVPAKHLRCCEDLASVRGDLSGWLLRPRALTLTLWARLLLADLFIHGIGGAKYDRITDTIMTRYYGVEPPHMACVSATLKMDFPGYRVTGAGIGQRNCSEPTMKMAKHALRDFEFNPQRHVESVGDAARWIERREQAVQRSLALHSGKAEGYKKRRTQRRETFDEIRRLNQLLANGAANMRVEIEAELLQAQESLRQDQIAQGREYFFALYEREALELLCSRLPSERDFRL